MSPQVMSTAPAKLTAATAFAIWLQHEDPQAFERLLAAAQAHAAAGARTVKGLGDWSSVISSIGSGLSTVASDVVSGLSSAASDVGGFLTSDAGQQTLADVAKAYMTSQQTQAQAQVLQTQIARASAGYAPAAISYATNPATGQTVPVYTGATLTPQIANAVNQGIAIPTTTNGGANGYTLTPALTASLQPSIFQKYGAWIVGGGLALVAAIALSRR